MWVLTFHITILLRSLVFTVATHGAVLPSLYELRRVPTIFFSFFFFASVAPLL
jgi:hypothetical protein